MRNNEALRLKYPPSLTAQKQLYLDGGALLVPFGDDAGGHGVPLAVDPDAPGFVCEVPEELPAEFVEPESGELEFVEPEFAEAAFVAIGSDAGLGVAGLEPGFKVAGFVEPAVPGMLPGEVAFGEDPFGLLCGEVCGVVWGVAGCADGVAVAAGGVALWAGGVTVPGELWTIVQLAQQQSMNNNVIILADIIWPPKLIHSSCRPDSPRSSGNAAQDSV